MCQFKIDKIVQGTIIIFHLINRKNIITWLKYREHIKPQQPPTRVFF